MGSTITGFWGSVTFYCKHHTEKPMELKQGMHSAYYGCRKEYDEEEPCHNRLNLIDAGKALQKIMDKINETSMSGDLMDMTNYQITLNGVIYKIVYHDPMNDKISIMVENRKILRGGH